MSKGRCRGAPGTNNLRGNMQIIVKTLPDETNTLDVEDQRHHRQCEDKNGMNDRTAVIDLRRKQLEDGKMLSDCNIQKTRLCCRTY